MCPISKLNPNEVLFPILHFSLLTSCIFFKDVLKIKVTLQLKD